MNSRTVHLQLAKHDNRGEDGGGEFRTYMEERRGVEMERWQQRHCCSALLVLVTAVGLCEITG